MEYRLFLFVVLFSSSTFGQDLEELCKQRVEAEETPGIAVSIYEGGKISYLNFGVADIGSKKLVTSKTLFEIGSITKTFTTTMLAKAVLAKQIVLSDPVQKYLPSSIILPKKDGRDITMLDLATARSGLPQMPSNFKPIDLQNPFVDYTEKELTAFLKDYQLTRLPGSQYEYSNVGMGLLGFVLANYLKKDYAQLVKDEILNPLGMQQTFVNIETQGQHVLASGYSDKIKMRSWTWANESVLVGAGGLVSCTEDMIQYLIAQMNRKAKLSKAFELARKERFDAGNLTYQIGLGWHIADHKYIWHNGGTGGFRSFVGFDPEKKRAIVILTNSTTGADDLGFHWLNSLYPIKSVKKSITLSAEKLKEYEGVYEISPIFKITISSNGSSLLAQATGQPQVPIYADTTDKFFLKIVPAKINFGRDDAGKVVKLTLFQNGATIEGKKVNQ